MRCLVWRAPSILMNPSLGKGRLARERRLDPSRFAREYEAEFVDDVAACRARNSPPANGLRFDVVVRDL